MTIYPFSMQVLRKGEGILMCVSLLAIRSMNWLIHTSGSSINTAVKMTMVNNLVCGDLWNKRSAQVLLGSEVL